MSAVNLIPRRVRERQVRTRRRRTWKRGLTAYAVLVTGLALIGQLPGESLGADRTDAIKERAQRRLDAATRAREQVDALLKDARGRVETARVIGNHPDWSIILKMLTTSRIGDSPEDVDAVLHSVEIAPVAPEPPAKPGSGAEKPAERRSAVERYVIRVVGYAPTPARVYEYVLRLERLGVFDSVAARDTRSERVGEALTPRFELELAISGTAHGAARKTGDRP